MATVTEIIADAQAYADGIAAQINSAADLVNTSAAISPVYPTDYEEVPPNIDNVTSAIADIQGSAPTDPTIETISALAPTIPTIEVPDVSSVVIPNFDRAAPSVVLGSAPSATFNPAPNAPTIIAPAAPDAPVYDLPELPTLSSFVIPDSPTFQMPTLYATAPEFTLTPPSNNFEWAEIAFEHDLKDELEAKLLNDIQNGGYGIEVSDELQIWDRARSRELSTARERMEETERVIASRGFAMPPGALLKATEKNLQALQDSSNTLSREIAIKRADLFVQNRQFTIQQVQQLVTTLLNYHAAKMERLLNAAKYTSEAAIAYFNASVERVRILLQQYQIETEVWVKTIEGEKAKADVYRSQLEALRIKGELDQRRVEIYKAQLQGIQIISEVYRTRVSAMQAFSEVERLKLETFRAQMDGHVASIKAKEVEFQAYEAAIRGETLKQQAFENDVRAYGVLVSAKKTEAEVLSEQNRARIASGELQLKVYEGQLDRYRSDVDSFYKREALKLQAFNGSVTAYSARGNLAAEVARLKISNDQVSYQSKIGVLNYNLGNARLQLDNIISSRSTKVQGATSVMNAYASQAQAALSGVNAIATQSA